MTTPADPQLVGPPPEVDPRETHTCQPPCDEERLANLRATVTRLKGELEAARAFEETRISAINELNSLLAASKVERNNMMGKNLLIERSMEDEACPLHSRSSKHPEPREPIAADPDPWGARELDLIERCAKEAEAYDAAPLSERHISTADRIRAIARSR